MKHTTFISLLLIIISLSCSPRVDLIRNHSQKQEQQLQLLTQHITRAEAENNLEVFLQFFGNDAISMPEYQVTLTGTNEIKDYYAEMFRRQQIKTLQRQPKEFIFLKNTIVEIGTFKKEYTESSSDSLIIVSGKYWYVWSVHPNGTYRIKGEAFGYFHPVNHAESLILSKHQQQINEAEINMPVPFELKAYNALMEKGVLQRNASLRTSFFTDDAILYPFADKIITGMNEIKPYLVAYSSRGTVTIDSVSCYTYACEDLGDHVLEYDMFKVKWSRPDVSGRTEGKGIRIWKRQPDKSLRLFREIGTHNYLLN